MWGNRLGWTISAVMVLAMAAALAAGSVLNRPSLPTPFVRQAGLDQALSLPSDPSTVLPLTDPSDAASLYTQAIELYGLSPSVYERFRTRTTLQPEDLRSLPAIDRVRQAAAMSQMVLFVGRQGEVIGYDSQDTPLAALRSVGLATARRGLLRQDQEPAEAMKDYEAAFSLGSKLFRERVTFQEMAVGLELMGETALQIAKLAEKQGDASRGAAIRGFESARQQFYRERIEPVWRVISSIDPKVVAEHPGDVRWIAANAAERMWRVEAILKLGRMRYFVGQNGRSADQRAANADVAVYATDTDPAIAAAGKAARDLTIEEYRTMR